ncbi:exodeoxyribonuclease VII large subunit [Haloimpatiens sp. FM7315]|uniref:exodeoxyribonuclease VII large subunit n=1 Tax=Haloimpatiens sp. FM7315 TaxID=3298609 RepID=UPI00370CDC03
MYIKTLTVGKLNNYIKKIMDNDFILKNIYVKGEISNFKKHTSGHMYFSLKDQDGKINCVMFREDAKNLTFDMENGMNVLVTGRVSLYVKEGNYQLYCNNIEIEGLGELHIAFENLKKKLLNEGIFDEGNKRELPKFPKKIGVITSPTGAAIKDIINVTFRRNPMMNITVYSALVQGDRASFEIIEGLKYFENDPSIDVIIVARGGGSIEELWAFNDENLAYSIYECKKPVVSGVGHETDFTIVDFVSDRRAPTPSAAAEIVVPDLQNEQRKLQDLKNNLESSIEDIIEGKYITLDLQRKNLQLNSPLNNIVNSYSVLENYKNIILNKINIKMSLEKEKLTRYRILLDLNNPIKLLDKGYSIILDEKRRLIKSTDELKKTQIVNIRLKDGEGKFKIKYMEDNNG